MTKTMTAAKTFTAVEALTLARFFARLEQMADREYRRDEQIALGIYRLVGELHVRAFDINDSGAFVPARALFEAPNKQQGVA